MKKSVILLITLLFVMNGLALGCLKSSSRVEIDFTLDLPLYRSELESVKWSEVEDNITNISFKIRVNPLMDSNITHIDVYNFGSMAYISWPENENDTRKSHFYASDIYFSDYSEEEKVIKTKKESYINKSNRIASICNLTIDWNKAKWTIYSDSLG